jgi:hypothetical protein
LPDLTFIVHIGDILSIRLYRRKTCFSPFFIGNRLRLEVFISVKRGRAWDWRRGGFHLPSRDLASQIPALHIGPHTSSPSQALVRRHRGSSCWHRSRCRSRCGSDPGLFRHGVCSRSHRSQATSLLVYRVNYIYERWVLLDSTPPELAETFFLFL